MKKAKGKRNKDAPVDEDAVEAFHLFAQDEGKGLDANGLRQALWALGVEKSEAQVLVLLDGREAMTQTAFLELVGREAKTRDDAEEAFKLLDEEEKGFITKEDLRNTATELQEKLSDADLDAMLKLAEDPDGVVTREAFLAFAKQTGLF